MRSVMIGLVALLAISFSARNETQIQSREESSAVKKKNASTQKAAPADQKGGAQTGSVQVAVKTSKGTFTIQLDAAKAPKTVENFLVYVNEGFFAGTVFHRVIKGFMIQGGGMTADLSRKATHSPIANEADNGLKNKRGTVAMARTGEPRSATSQFFVNTVDNAFLDFSSPDPRGWGYCVFGKVVSGMDVVDKIESAATTSKMGNQDVPVEPITIESVSIVK